MRALWHRLGELHAGRSPGQIIVPLVASIVSLVVLWVGGALLMVLEPSAGTPPSPQEPFTVADDPAPRPARETASQARLNPLIAAFASRPAPSHRKDDAHA